MKASEEHFKCDMCGICCQSVSLSKTYKHLDRGDGTCRFYEEDTHRCSIYSSRPLICNIEAYYEAELKGKLDKTEYFEMNYEVCRRLKKEV